MLLGVMEGEESMRSCFDCGFVWKFMGRRRRREALAFSVIFTIKPASMYDGGGMRNARNDVKG